MSLALWNPKNPWDSLVRFRPHQNTNCWKLNKHSWNQQLHNEIYFFWSLKPAYSKFYGLFFKPEVKDIWIPLFTDFGNQTVFTSLWYSSFSKRFWDRWEVVEVQVRHAAHSEDLLNAGVLGLHSKGFLQHSRLERREHRNQQGWRGLKRMFPLLCGSKAP